MATETTAPAQFALPPAGSFELIRAVEEGLPTECLQRLKDWGLTFTEVAQLILPPRTLKHRKARGERLSPDETERFLRVMRVLELGERVFGKREKLLNWLRSPDPEMGDRSSMSLIRTAPGAERVTEQLWAIAEGFAS